MDCAAKSISVFNRGHHTELLIMITGSLSGKTHLRYAFHVDVQQAAFLGICEVQWKKRTGTATMRQVLRTTKGARLFLSPRSDLNNSKTILFRFVDVMISHGLQVIPKHSFGDPARRGH